MYFRTAFQLMRFCHEKMCRAVCLEKRCYNCCRELKFRETREKLLQLIFNILKPECDLLLFLEKLRKLWKIVVSICICTSTSAHFFPRFSKFFQEQEAVVFRFENIKYQLYMSSSPLPLKTSSSVEKNMTFVNYVYDICEPGI